MTTQFTIAIIHLPMKSYLRFISSVVVLAFTITSMGTVPKEDCPHECISPQSRFGSADAAKQLLQQRADDLATKINSELKDRRAGTYSTTVEIEAVLEDIIRKLLASSNFHIQPFREKRAGIGHILARQSKSYEVVALLHFKDGATFVIAHCFAEGKAGVFPYEPPPSAPKSPVSERSVSRALATLAIILGLGAFAAALAYLTPALALSEVEGWSAGEGISGTLAKIAILIILVFTGVFFIHGIYRLISNIVVKQVKINKIWQPAIVRALDRNDPSPLKEAFKKIASRRDLGGEDGETGDRFNESYKIIENSGCVSLYISALADIISNDEDGAMREYAAVALNRIARLVVNVQTLTRSDDIDRYVLFADIKEGLKVAVPSLEAALTKEADARRNSLFSRVLAETKLALGHSAAFPKAAEPEKPAGAPSASAPFSVGSSVKSLLPFLLGLGALGIALAVHPAAGAALAMAVPVGRLKVEGRRPKTEETTEIVMKWVMSQWGKRIRNASKKEFVLQKVVQAVTEARRSVEAMAQREGEENAQRIFLYGDYRREPSITDMDGGVFFAGLAGRDRAWSEIRAKKIEERLRAITAGKIAHEAIEQIIRNWGEIKRELSKRSPAGQKSSRARQSGRTFGEVLGFGVVLAAITYLFIDVPGRISVPIAVGTMVSVWIIINRKSSGSSLRSFLPFIVASLPALFGCWRMSPAPQQAPTQPAQQAIPKEAPASGNPFEGIMRLNSILMDPAGTPLSKYYALRDLEEEPNAGSSIPILIEVASEPNSPAVDYPGLEDGRLVERHTSLSLLAIKTLERIKAPSEVKIRALEKIAQRNPNDILILTRVREAIERLRHTGTKPKGAKQTMRLPQLHPPIPVTEPQLAGRRSP